MPSYPQRQVGAIWSPILPKDVSALMAQVDADMGQVNDMAACTSLDPMVRSHWTAFADEYAAWRKDNDGVSILPVLWLSQYHDLSHFEERARDWEKTLTAAGCPLVGPSIIPHPSSLPKLLEIGGVGVAVGAGLAIALVLLLGRKG